MMRKYFAMAVGLLMLAACAQKSVNAVADSEPATITWIEDKPGGTLQPHTLYPDVPDSLWSALGLQEGVPSSMSCFLLRADGKTILLDAGLGAPFSQLLPKLNELGLTPEELRLIYITHLHPDHIGGLLKDGKMAFPKAELYVNRIEAEAWQAMEGERSQLAKNVLKVYNERLHLFEAGDTLDGGVITIAAYGHTPGHTVFQKDSILVIADLIHGAALQMQHPEYCPTYDMDADAARQSRLRILEYARRNGLTMYGMHLPSPGYIANGYGVCVIKDGKPMGARINDTFAMHSIVKFPQALYVAMCMDSIGISLNETMEIRKDELMPDTWSPMLRMIDGAKQFTYAELLQLSLAQSDNNACDILFQRFGGPEKVTDFIHQLGFNGIHIKWTERQMGADPKRSADNCCTPCDMARLFEWLVSNKDRSDNLRFVWQTMASCETGGERIASIIPQGSTFVHKTGTGFPSDDQCQDRNDAGVVVMPDGTCQPIAVFVPQSRNDAEVASIGQRYLEPNRY